MHTLGGLLHRKHSPIVSTFYSAGVHVSEIDPVYACVELCHLKCFLGLYKLKRYFMDNKGTGLKCHCSI